MTSITQSINSAIPAMAWDATVNIVIVLREELHQFGTGTLLKIADDVFLVTAAHVVQIAIEQGNSLCFAVDKNFIPIYGIWACSPGHTPSDVAIMRLHPEISQKLTNVSFVRLHDIDFTSDLSSGVFCLCGYPTILSTPSTAKDPTMNSQPFQYATYTYEGETNTLDNYQDKYHLLLNADGIYSSKKSTYFQDRRGTIHQFPQDLGGMSGCSVWKIGNRDKSKSKWSPSRAKIVAVQTSVYPNTKIIKATRWFAVSSVIYEAYPDLRPSMNLLYVEYEN